MKTLKQLSIHRFNAIAILCVGIVFSIALIAIRATLTGTISYLFLMWNLFLAFIPFGISSLLKRFGSINRFVFFSVFGVWLAFLPNAPYIITDLVHLRYSSLNVVWLDGLIICTFALTGLVLFYVSIGTIFYILKQYIKPLFAIYIIPLLCFITAFGIYLGRFLRYNSWEIIQNPKPLFTDILNILLHPITYREPWLFTVLFGMFLYIGYWAFQSLESNPSSYSVK